MARGSERTTELGVAWLGVGLGLGLGLGLGFKVRVRLRVRVRTCPLEGGAHIVGTHLRPQPVLPHRILHLG